MKRLYKNTWQWIRSHKIFVVVIVAAVIVGLYVLGSAMSWQQYQDRYEKSIAMAKTDIDTVLALPQKTTEEKGQKTTALSEVAAKQADLDCQVNILFSWQRILGNQAKIDECDDVLEKLSALRQALQNVATYLGDEQVLLEKMVVNMTPERISEEDFQSQIAQWQEVRRDVMSLDVDESFQPVKEKALEAVGAILNAWQLLLDAHVAEDQVVYEDARTKLPESYDRLAAIAPIADSRLVELTKTLQTAYNAL